MFFFLDPSQLWKLDEKKLINKAKLWSSEDIFDVTNGTYDGNFEYIEKIPFKNKTFVLQREGPNTDYFTLKDSKSSKILTAFTGNKLGIKG